MKISMRPLLMLLIIQIGTSLLNAQKEGNATQTDLEKYQAEIETLNTDIEKINELEQSLVTQLKELDEKVNTAVEESKKARDLSGSILQADAAAAKSDADLVADSLQRAQAIKKAVESDFSTQFKSQVEKIRKEMGDVSTRLAQAEEQGKTFVKEEEQHNEEKESGKKLENEAIKEGEGAAPEKSQSKRRARIKVEQPGFFGQTVMTIKKILSPFWHGAKAVVQKLFAWGYTPKVEEPKEIATKKKKPIVHVEPEVTKAPKKEEVAAAAPLNGEEVPPVPDVTMTEIPTLDEGAPTEPAMVTAKETKPEKEGKAVKKEESKKVEPKKEEKKKEVKAEQSHVEKPQKAAPAPEVTPAMPTETEKAQKVPAPTEESGSAQATPDKQAAQTPSAEPEQQAAETPAAPGEEPKQAEQPAEQPAPAPAEPEKTEESPAPEKTEEVKPEEPPAPAETSQEASASESQPEETSVQTEEVPQVDESGG